MSKETKNWVITSALLKRLPLDDELNFPLRISAGLKEETTKARYSPVIKELSIKKLKIPIQKNSSFQKKNSAFIPIAILNNGKHNCTEALYI